MGQDFLERERETKTDQRIFSPERDRERESVCERERERERERVCVRKRDVISNANFIKVNVPCWNNFCNTFQLYKTH